MEEVFELFGVPVTFTEIVIVFFLILLAILWFVLPFEIIGTKPLINKGNSLADETNDLLSKIGKQLAAQTELLERIEKLAMGNESPSRKPSEDTPMREEEPTPRFPSTTADAPAATASAEGSAALQSNYRLIEEYRGTSIYMRRSDNRFCVGQERKGSFLSRSKAREYIDEQ